MSWIKTLWLWEEVALCLLLGLSFIWGHMWWIAGVLVPAAWDSRRCPVLIWFFFFFAPPPRWLPHVLFKNDCTDPAPHSLISCTCTKGRQDREGTARTKREGQKDTHSRRAHSHSFIRCALGSKRHRAQVHFSSAAVRMWPDWVQLPLADREPWQLDSVCQLVSD